MSDSATLHSKWLLLPKIEISLVVNFCFITNQNMASTEKPGIYVKLLLAM
jgi:hypothetical protein